MFVNLFAIISSVKQNSNYLFSDHFRSRSVENRIHQAKIFSQREILEKTEENLLEKKFRLRLFCSEIPALFILFRAPIYRKASFAVSSCWTTY